MLWVIWILGILLFVGLRYVVIDVFDLYFNVLVFGIFSCKSLEYLIGDLMFWVVLLDKFFVLLCFVVDFIDIILFVEDDLCLFCLKDVVCIFLFLYGLL